MTTTTAKTTAEADNVRTPRRQVMKGSSLVAVLVGTVLIAASCGGSSTSSASPSPNVSAASATSQAADAVSPVTSSVQAGQAPAPTAVLVAEPATAADKLRLALTSMGASYEFSSVITTGSGDQVVIEGQRVGDGLNHRIVVGGAAVDVVTVADRTWIRQDGDSEWVESTEATKGDPLAPLAQPISIGDDPSTPGAFRATYLAEALGLDTADAVDVLIRIDGDSVSFTSVTGSISLETILTRVATLAPILPPV